MILFNSIQAARRRATSMVGDHMRVVAFSLNILRQFSLLHPKVQMSFPDLKLGKLIKIRLRGVLIDVIIPSPMWWTLLPPSICGLK